MRKITFTMERLRNLALGMIIGLNAVATIVSFGESYFGLYRWATEHGVAGFWGGVWPMMVDLIILVAEAALFVAHHDKWQTRHKAWLWTVLFTALGVSTGANTGHVHSTDYLSHLTAALPPVALMFTMTVGFGVMKRTFMNKRPDGDGAAAQPLTPPPATVLTPVSHRPPESVSAPPSQPLTETAEKTVIEVAQPLAEKPPYAPETIAIPESLEPTETFAGDFRIVPGKSFTMPRDPRTELSLPEKRIRDMFDVDPDISTNAAAKALGIAWATADKYLRATKEARGLAA